jgi:uncharacterized protein YkwD
MMEISIACELVAMCHHQRSRQSHRVTSRGAARRKVLIMRQVVVSLLALVVVAGGVAAPALAAPTSHYCADAQEVAFLQKINTYRVGKGLPKLRLTQTLGAAADHHSVDMARNNYFSHTLSGGISWEKNIANHGYPSNTTRGENIAAGNATASATFTQWRNSPPHNANMTSGSFRAIGIGRAYDASSTYGWYWTTTFGSTADAVARRC